jgi:hypothetical protein
MHLLIFFAAVFIVLRLIGVMNRWIDLLTARLLNVPFRWIGFFLSAAFARFAGYIVFIGIFVLLLSAALDPNSQYQWTKDRPCTKETPLYALCAGHIDYTASAAPAPVSYTGPTALAAAPQAPDYPDFKLDPAQVAAFFARGGFEAQATAATAQTPDPVGAVIQRLKSAPSATPQPFEPGYPIPGLVAVPEDPAPAPAKPAQPAPQQSVRWFYHANYEAGGNYLGPFHTREEAVAYCKASPPVLKYTCKDSAFWAAPPVQPADLVWSYSDGQVGWGPFHTYEEALAYCKAYFLKCERSRFTTSSCDETTARLYPMAYTNTCTFPARPPSAEDLQAALSRQYEPAALPVGWSGLPIPNPCLPEVPGDLVTCWMAPQPAPEAAPAADRTDDPHAQALQELLRESLTPLN